VATRPYASATRDAAAATKRARVIDAATRLLREQGTAALSMEAVAKAAGVTRLTVYNQFNSRRGLLEAILDALAGRGGLDRIGEVMRVADPGAALDRLIDLFYHFWSFDASVGQLHALAANDAEFAEIVARRIERRRAVIGSLVARMQAAGQVERDAGRDLVDLLFALTSYTMFDLLRVNGRTDAAILLMIKDACGAAIARASPLRD
jgi:AcrR family transcriptional regulator